MPIILFLILVLFIGLLGALIAYSFARNSFLRDRTMDIISVFAAAFFFVTTLTIAIYFFS
jgi:hypothetical protein